MSFFYAEKCNYKNRLQEWTQRNNQKLPVYLTQSKGDPHQLVFRSTVEVGGKTFPSDHNHSRLKDAEQDAAKVACKNLVTIDDPTDVLGLIEQVLFGYRSFFFVVYHISFHVEICSVDCVLYPKSCLLIILL
jgi:hypothetical protein